jgi:hypothetical protein
MLSTRVKRRIFKISTIKMSESETVRVYTEQEIRKLGLYETVGQPTNLRKVGILEIGF